jgi:branched-subunit amino acid aminotransferase/4-amino-4-deoxychorismate lyase
VRERTVSRNELAEADEVFASGSVRGVEPVQAYEDVRQWKEGAVTRDISARLRRLWLGEHYPV